LVADCDSTSAKLFSQGHSQEFAKGGDKPGGLGDGSPPAGSRDRAPVGYQKAETNVEKKSKQTTNMRQ